MAWEGSLESELSALHPAGPAAGPATAHGKFKRPRPSIASASSQSEAAPAAADKDELESGGGFSDQLGQAGTGASCSQSTADDSSCWNDPEDADEDWAPTAATRSRGSSKPEKACLQEPAPSPGRPSPTLQSSCSANRLLSWKKATKLARGSARDRGQEPLECPFQAGPVTVISLGSISSEVSHRTGPSNYVWPIGFTSVREYKSVHDPSLRVPYRSEILQPVPGQPAVVRVTAVGREEATSWEGPSPTHAWEQVLRAVNEVDKGRKRVAASGPQFIGLAHPKIASEIAKLPGYEASVSKQRAMKGGR